jgi:hypothetical protein
MAYAAVILGVQWLPIAEVLTDGPTEAATLRHSRCETPAASIRGRAEGIVVVGLQV